RFDVLVHPRMTEIDDVNEQIGFAHFFERRLERFDQRVLQSAGECDRGGQRDALAVWQGEAARRRIEGGEKLVFGNDVGTGQQVEEGRFAGVRVTDDGGDRPL